MPLPEETAVVPTVADLDEKWGLRKEALRSLNAIEKAAWLSAGFDEVLAALGKRVTRPVSFIDDFLKSLACRIASANLLGWRRGLNPLAGQDAWIQLALEGIEKDLEDIRLGRVEVFYKDATPFVGEQGPSSGGDATPDAYFKCRYPASPYYPGCR